MVAPLLEFELAVELAFDAGAAAQALLAGTKEVTAEGHPAVSGIVGIASRLLRVPDGLERAYQAYTSAFPDNLLPTPEGVKTMLDDLAPKNPKAASADPKAFVDPSLIRELDSSWFIKQLYKR